mmetsp:Transcript_14933/g.25925  ORF Transcript_14933/g.25925 Transcript_14933/m.25925 type:complete len:108 (-) Transcript_14933:888-1211(-)
MTKRCGDIIHCQPVDFVDESQTHENTNTQIQTHEHANTNTQTQTSPLYSIYSQRTRNKSKRVGEASQQTWVNQESDISRKPKGRRQGRREDKTEAKGSREKPREAKK